ncbi:uncharacterized protein TM35_000231310 [Trypanosoma theileri]|uniref:Uncharacterized protein n=1 Tax=Trypanosoma theileri TaxID=67003 RepID=A0A1X0NSS1_9TRYP|nr:uncharacterized protein TM35_000231310 [Trypanosoma theileri]ORC87160.1 hypothetical protein TM35_000231310 [Trypanosoma theileri]
MSVDIASYPHGSQRVFTDTATLRQAVMSPADAYTRYERQLLDEVNALRCNPAAYADVVATAATVAYPFVRDDPTPARCSAMTLPQLRVYIADFRRERETVATAAARVRHEWEEAVAAQQLRWAHEDTERARRVKRGSVRRPRGGATANSTTANVSSTSSISIAHTSPTGGGGTSSAAAAKEEDFMREREREAQELQAQYTQKLRELESKGVQLERACKWAIEGANLIINCVKKLRKADAVPPLEYSRSLTLAARDVGNASRHVHSETETTTPSTPEEAIAVTPAETGTTPPFSTAMSTKQQQQQGQEQGGGRGEGEKEQEKQQEKLPSSLPALQGNRTSGEGEEVLLTDRSAANRSDSDGCISRQVLSQVLSTPACSLPPEEDRGSNFMRNESRKTNSISKSENNSNNNDMIGNLTVLNVSAKNADTSSSPPLIDVFDESTPGMGNYTTTVNEFKKEETLLKKTTMKVCSRYGYFSGALRGLQFCGAFNPRKTLVQMLLGLQVPQFVLVAPNSVPDVCKFLHSHSNATNQLDSPLLWDAGRLLGCGWVRSPDGVVSVTVLIATNFEELSLIHERRDFSLPQIHRILNSHNVLLRKGLTSSAVVHVHSKLDVQVMEPVSHPIFVDRQQKMARLIVKADSNIVEITATVSAAAEPVPSVPMLDRELLLVQRRQDDLEEVEILLDIRAAWRRWSGQPLFVHLFERDKSAGGLGSFTNIGFIRVTPTPQLGGGGGGGGASTMNHISSSSQKQKQQQQQQQQRLADTSVIRTSAQLSPQSCIPPIDVKEEIYGWPLVTSDFQERCATIIEPLAGTWIAIGNLQHIVIQIPNYEYLKTTIDNVRFLLEKEDRYATWEERCGSEHHIKKMIESTTEELKTAEETLNANSGPIQQELAQLQKNMTRKRNKEMIRLKKQEDELRKRLKRMEDDVEELRQVLTDAQRDLVMLCREYTLHAKRRDNLEQEYKRLCDRADRTKPLRVEVRLIASGAESCMAAECTSLRPVNSVCTLYEGDVRVPRGFTGSALLLVNEQEAVQWEVRPGY